MGFRLLSSAATIHAHLLRQIKFRRSFQIISENGNENILNATRERHIISFIVSKNEEEHNFIKINL